MTGIFFSCKKEYSCEGCRPSPADKAILVDASRDGGVWWYPQAGPFSSIAPHQGKNLADYLRSLGYRVDELERGTVITSALLNNYSNVVRCGVFGNYTADEIAAYNSFLNRPSTALLLAQDFITSSNDQLSAQLGLNFEGSHSGTVTSFASHIITNGVSSLPYIAGSYILNYDPTKVTVLGSVQLASGGMAAVMGLVTHPNTRIFFIGDVNCLEQVSQPFSSNLIPWLFR